eukprot:5296365-Prymnesium_polylepis.2
MVTAESGFGRTLLVSASMPEERRNFSAVLSRERLARRWARKAVVQTSPSARPRWCNQNTRAAFCWQCLVPSSG